MINIILCMFSLAFSLVATTIMLIIPFMDIDKNVESTKMIMLYTGLLYFGSLVLFLIHLSSS